MRYHEPVFRPPSEWDSQILQVTHGCAWNGCHFCEMYKSKQFWIKPVEELAKELQKGSRWGGFDEVRRIFLADGNATVLPFDQLKAILELLQRFFPKLRRVSSYASPADLLAKSEMQLSLLRSLGLTRLYVGIESGDAQVLGQNNKRETPQSTLAGLRKAQDAGFELSVMILLGLGGRERSKEHIESSAQLLNALQPYQLSLLVIGYPFGLDHYQKKVPAPFTPLSLSELIGEMGQLVNALDLKRSHFRADHASNFLPIQGVLGRDKVSILKAIAQFATAVPPSSKPYLPVVG